MKYIIKSHEVIQLKEVKEYITPPYMLHVVHSLHIFVFSLYNFEVIPLWQRILNN